MVTLLLLVERDIWLAILLYKVTKHCTPLIIKHSTGIIKAMAIA